jgi:hypothetical protein
MELPVWRYTALEAVVSVILNNRTVEKNAFLLRSDLFTSLAIILRSKDLMR